jgi:peptidoglycan/LPS O-acetylase OafA/YrhL
VWHWLQNIREAGNFGVCAFFLLSSFLITELLRRELLKTGKVHLKAFYVRRSLRIWPLYFAVLSAVVIIGFMGLAQTMPMTGYLAFFFFVSNWWMILHVGAANPLSWLWSISVEEQFYVLWPTLAKLGGTRVIAIGSALCIPVSIAAITYAKLYQQHLDVTIWLNSAVQFQFFGLGALLAIFLSGRLPQISQGKRLALAAVGAASWIAASALCGLKSANATPSLLQLCVGYELAAAGCLCLFLALFGMSPTRFPEFVVYLGKISYGLYVYHEFALSIMTFLRYHLEQSLSAESELRPVLFAADRVLSLALTIAVATISYRFLESPFLKLKERFTFVPSRGA